MNYKIKELKAMVKGLIFDFNGTLYFDTDKQEEAWRIYIQKKYHRSINPTEFRDHIHGRAFDSIFEYYLGSDSSEKEQKEMIEEKEAIYREIARADQKNLHLVSGAESLFDELSGRKIPFTVATASGIKNVKFYFEVFPLYKWFVGPEDWVYDDGTIPGKPEPDIYLKAAKKIGIEPANCLVVEDSFPGITAAIDAGIGKVIAMNPAGDRDKIEKMNDVKAIISDFNGFAERFLNE